MKVLNVPLSPAPSDAEEFILPPKRAPKSSVNIPHNTYPRLLQIKDYVSISKLAERNHLTDNNRDDWKIRMHCMLINCDITEYTDRTIKRPDPSENPAGAQNWDKNDSWAQQVIMQNVTSSQINHIRLKNTSEKMVLALVNTHDNKANQTINYIQTLLYETKATKGSNIAAHLDILKSYRDHLNRFPNAEFHVYDTRFKSIILGSSQKVGNNLLNHTTVM